MIVKERNVPLRIMKMEALLRRLNPAHPQIANIRRDLIRWKAGFKGEQSVDYHMNFLDVDRYLILHDFRFPNANANGFTQIDTLIISPKFILILEIKNYSGTIIFDKKVRQLIRVYQNKEESFPDPILQVERQLMNLKLFLMNLQYPAQKMFSYVVISNPSTLVKFNPADSKSTDTVIHASAVIDLVDQLERRVNESEKTSIQVHNLASLFLKHHGEENMDILNEYSIKEEEVLRGVLCRKCNRLGMGRIRGKWVCKECAVISREAHLLALMDYVLLKGPVISRKEYQSFITLDSDSSAVKQLSKSPYTKKIGITKGSEYEVDVRKLIKQFT